MEVSLTFKTKLRWLVSILHKMTPEHAELVKAAEKELIASEFDEVRKITAISIEMLYNSYRRDSKNEKFKS